MGGVPLCCYYNKPIQSANDFFEAEPQYTYINGWSDARDISQLKSFLHLTEHHTKRKVSYISYGPSQDDIQQIDPGYIHS